VKRLLAKHGYPAEPEAQVITLVLEQTETRREVDRLSCRSRPTVRAKIAAHGDPAPAPLGELASSWQRGEPN
jgi:hypothetical protein